MSAHFLELYLLRHPITLLVVGVGMYALNMAGQLLLDGEGNPPGWPPGASLRGWAVRLRRLFYGALLFLLPGLVLGGELKAFVLGAFLVLQGMTLAARVTAWGVSRALARPGARSGQMVCSAATRLRLQAANLQGMAVVSLMVAILTGSPSFLAASLYLGIYWLGYGYWAQHYDEGHAGVPPGDI